MLNSISNYFDNNFITGIIIIIFIFVLLFYFNNYKCPSEKETFNQCSKNNDDEFYKQYVGPTKIINFKTKIDNKEYYLVNVKLEECKSHGDVDCTNIAIILMDKDEIDEMVTDYIKELKTTQAICQSTKTIKCESKLPINATNIEKEKCKDIDPSCIEKRFFKHDFIVTEVTDIKGDQPEARKYLLKGMYVSENNNFKTPTLLNQHVYNNFGTPFLCGDKYDYGSSNFPNNYGEVVVIENIKQHDGGIIGGLGSNLKVKLRFTTNIVIVTTESDGKKVYTPVFSDGIHPSTKNTYVGYCKSDVCTLSNGKNYKRVCLYDDSSHTNVLEFEPIIVSAI